MSKLRRWVGSALALALFSFANDASASKPVAPFHCAAGFALSEDVSDFTKLALEPIELGVLAAKSFGFTKKKLVVRMDCTAATDLAAPQAINFFIRYPVLDHIEVYEASSTGEPRALAKLGDVDRSRAASDPGQNGVVPHFAYSFSSGETKTFWLVLGSQGSLQAPILPKDGNESIRFLEPLNFGAGLYYGLILSMVLFNLFLFFSLKDTLYLKYVLYVFFYSVFQAAADGFGNFYFWRFYEPLTRYAVPVSIPLFLGFILTFSGHYLNLRNFAPRFDRLFRVTAILLFSFAGLSIFLPYRASAMMGAIGSPVVATMALVASGYVWHLGFMPARYFFLAWVVFLLGIVMMSLRNLGFVPHSFLTTYAIQIGSGMETLLIAFGLAYRIRILTQEKEKANADNERLKVETRVLTETANLASQVSHDIRSPLAALDVALRDVNALPEENRLVVRNALNRIRDIANNLLRERKTRLGAGSKAPASPAPAPEAPTEPVLLSALVDSLVSEKRYQYRPFQNISIERTIHSRNFHLFVRVNANELKRVLSNLVSNAVEAGGENGIGVELNFEARGDEVELSVTDNGRGIPPEILRQFNEGRFHSHGKRHSTESGHGLGLPYAERLIRRFGGRLRFESHANGPGTTVKVILPIERNPGWMVEKLVLRGRDPLFIVDDDEHIHGIWRARLEPLGAAALRLEKTHHKNLEGFARDFKERAPANFQVLIDHEFFGQSRRGVDVVAELDIAPQSVLVTSRYEDADIQARAKALGLRILPKNLAVFVPIEIV